MSHDLGLKHALPQSIEPLSFKEYCNIFSIGNSQDIHTEKIFLRYLCFGSLPKTVELQSGSEISEYLEDRYGAALLKGIALVRPRTNMQAYLSLLSYIAQNIGMLMSPGSLAGELEKRGVSIAKNTIAEYLKLAYESDILCCAKRIDLKTDALLTRGEKYYLKDLGLRYFIEKQVPEKESRDALIENAIYLELSRRYEKVFIGKLGEHTVDFVCLSEDDTGSGCAKRHYYQIVHDPFNFDAKREKITPLLAIKDNYPKTLLALEKKEGECVAGIKCEYVVNWLLGQSVAKPLAKAV